MPTRARFLLRSLGVLVLVACAAVPPTSEPAAAAPARANSDVITRAELADPAIASRTVVEAIRRLRPRFLNERSTSIHGEAEGALVSIAGGAPGLLSEPARLEVADVQEIRYPSPGDAQLRFGLTGSLRPVLLVTLRTR